MPSTSNFDLTYNQQNVVAGGALSNPAATTGTSTGTGVTKIIQGTNVTISPTSGVGDVTISATAGGTGTVTEVKGQGSVNGITLTGDVTTSGYLTLGGTLGSIANTQLSNSTITIAGNSTALGGTVTQDQITGLSATTAGIVKHTSTANTLALATAGTDYSAGTSALATGIVKSTTSTGALSIATNTDVSNTFPTSSTANQVYATPNGTTGVPTLRSLVSADIPSLNYVASSGGTATNLTLAGTLKDSNSSSAGTSGQVLSSTATGTKWITPSSGGNVTGTGTSTSGNFAAFNNGSATGINDTGYSPSSFISATATQTPHYVLAGPSSGSAAAPTFRAIVPSDVPTLNQNTTGTAANVTGVVAVANGGTGTATPSLVAGTGISVTGSFPNQTITNTTPALPSGGSISQTILKNSSGAGWYTEHFNVKVFGATGDGSTDDHTAVNSAISALNLAGGGTLYFPYGTYKMTSAITTITVPCRVIGDGINASTINQTSTSDALVISTSSQCIVQDITLQCTSSYNALTLTAPSGGFNSRSIINNVNVGGTPAIGFNFNEAFAVVTNCTVTGAIGIKMQNLVNPDESAGMITQCQINTNGGTAIALYADGVQVIDNYFYDNNYAVEIFVNNSTGTLSDFWITNNHIEYCLISAIRFNNTSTGSGNYLVNVLISNNEIAWSPPSGVSSTPTCNGVDQSGTLTSIQWLQDFTISDNVFNTNVDNIRLTYASNGTIVGNAMNTCTNGIYLDTNTSNIVAKDNLIVNATTAATDNGSSNLVGNDVGYTSVPTLTGGSATETKYLSVTQSVLGKKPDGVSAQVTSDPTVGCYYNWDDSGNSKTQVAIVFFKYSGGNLSSGAVRYTLRCGP